MRRIIATLSLCLLTFALATEADAKPRKKKIKKPDPVAVVLKQNNALLRELTAMKVELAAITRRLTPDLPPPAIVYDVVPPLETPRNPVLSAPMPMPSLNDYKKHVEATAKPVTGKIAGLKSALLDPLKRLHAAMPAGMSFKVVSGFRTWREQAALHRAKPRLAARPGRSKHQLGLAADLTYSSPQTRRWVHRNAKQYGLRFPMGYEPWHIEPARTVTRTRYARAG